MKKNILKYKLSYQEHPLIKVPDDEVIDKGHGFDRMVLQEKNPCYETSLLSYCLRYFLFILAFLPITIHAQTTIATTATGTSFWSSSSSALVFGIENTNSYGIVVTDLASYTPANNNATYTVWYHPTNITGVPPDITTTNGWIQLPATAVISGTTAGITPMFSNLGLMIPANAIYRVALVASANGPYYGTSGSGPVLFSGGGVNIHTQASTVSPTYVGYFPGPVSNTPRGFYGSITFIPAVPCTAPPTAGTAVATPATGLCSGSSVVLSLTGNSGGTGLTYQWEDSVAGNPTWTLVGSASSIPVASVSATSTRYFRAAVTCNGQTSYSNPVLVTVNPQFPGGTYTIDSTQATGGTNFRNFTDAVAAISCGISGPIVFNIAPGSGPYNEQINLPATIGATAANTVTFNGHGDTLSFGGSSSNFATLNLDGADHIIFKNLVIQATGSVNSVAVHLMNGADDNVFDSCIFLANNTVNVTTVGCVNMSGSLTSYSTTGANGSNNIFSNCISDGGFYGFYFYSSSAAANTGNQVINCRVDNFYQYGIYYLNQGNGSISTNIVERTTRTIIGSYYGIYVSTGCTNTVVERNKLRNSSGGNPGGILAAYCIYVSATSSAGNVNKIHNNLVYDMNTTSTIAGIYMPSATYVEAYHNTISIDNNTANSGTAYGIYTTGTSNVFVRNNNISITQPGTGNKYCLYFSGAGKTSDYNNLYVNSLGGNNYTGYASTATPTTYTSLATWQTANSNAYDQNSMDLDPFFASPSTGDYTPTNSLIDNMGTVVGVADDITGATRNATTPDVGAIEFSVPVCTGTPVAGTAAVAGNITSACLGGSVRLSLSGFTIGSGISIEWEESPSGAGIWTPITGATSNAYTDVLVGATDYRAKVTCANGGGFDVSNTITINTNPFYLCYCSPNTGVVLHTASSNYITNVTILNSTLNSATSAVGIGGYTLQDYTVAANTTTLTQGSTYTLNASISSATYGTELWIDWDQNGAFDTAEYLLLTPGTTSTVTFQVPANAVPGLTGMRLRTISSATVKYANAGACSSVTNTSETEDYVITVAQGVQCNGIPSMPGAIAANDSSICNGGDVTLSLFNFPVELGLSFQWESSLAAQNNFTPIAGATGYSYTTGALSADMDYRMAVTCTNASGGTAYSNILTISVSNPQLLSTNGATRCGVGTVNLTAAAPAGSTVNWYADMTGGSPVDTGNILITPVLTATDTFYAAAIQGGVAATVGRDSNYTPGDSYNTGSTGIYFDALTPFTLNSVMVYPYSAANNTPGTITIALQDNNGVNIQTATVNVIGYNSAVGQTVALNFNVPAGTGYRLIWVTPGNGITGLYREYTSTPFNFPYTVPGAVNMISSWNGSSTFAYYYYFYRWQITTGCEGSRVPVVATVNPAPSYTISASPDTICAGSSSTVSVNSANNYIYSWTPTGSGSSFVSTPAATTTYVVSGVDGNNCGILDSVTVNVKSAPAAATVSASPDAICVSGSTTVTISPTPMYGIDIAWEKNTGSGYAVIPGATDATYTESVSTTTYYRANLYCNSTLITTSTEDTVTYSNPQVSQIFPGERCGPGPVTLAAMGANGAGISWYANATGGTALVKGNAFTTPSLSATTTYYAAPVSGGGSISIGAPNNGQNTGYTLEAGLFFNALVPFTINGVYVYPVGTGAGTVDIALKDPSGTNLQTITANLTGTAAPGIKTFVPLNFTVPVGTGLSLVMLSRSGGVSSLVRDGAANITGGGFPYTVPGVMSITSGRCCPSATSTSYYYFYDWLITTGCEGTRVPVTATINPAASGTGLATGGTTVGTSQSANTTESYTDACNDTVAVVASGSTALGTTSAIVLTSTTVPTHQNKPFVPRAYDINPATDGPATVTLYALQSEFNAYNSYVTGNSLSLPLLPTGPSDLTGMGNIVITQYHGSASAGTQGPLGLYSSTNVDFIQNSSITVTPVGNYWKLTFPVTGFSGFFIHTGANPLAIDLKNISAVNMGSRNRVDWTTGTEQSGDRFELERSADGTNFRKLADIAAKGQPSGYSYWDETPVTGVNYYRLKLVDASGKGSYSKVVTATVKSGSFTVEAYPNPVKDVLTVKVFGVQGKDATVSITDITGKVIRIEAMSSDKTTIEMSGLAQGMYLIKYADSDNSQTIKVNKQ